MVLSFKRAQSNGWLFGCKRKQMINALAPLSCHVQLRCCRTGRVHMKRLQRLGANNLTRAGQAPGNTGHEQAIGPATPGAARLPLQRQNKPKILPQDAGGKDGSHITTCNSAPPGPSKISSGRTVFLHIVRRRKAAEIPVSCKRRAGFPSRHSFSDH